MGKPINPGTDNQPNPRIVNIDPGDRLPPTQEPGHKWQKK